MAALPAPMHSTANLIYAAYVAGDSQAMKDFRKKYGVPEPDDGLRPHLGASQIGKACDRQLWYTFRWAERKSFEGRMLRLFETGHLEEPRLVANLRAIGVTVHDTDPSGAQWRVETLGGHFGGSMDGALVGVPEAPKTWHVGEFKTASEKVFNEMKKKGVKLTKPEHYWQVTTYMGLTGMERALYIMKNKNTDELHVERVEFDADLFKKIIDRATRIVNAEEPPARISDDPSWYECKFCDFQAQCHGTTAPLVNCRTCAHSTPEMGGNQLWTCADGNGAKHPIPLSTQKVGCSSHRYIPVLLGRLGQLVTGENNEVAYRKKNGTVFVNGEAPGSYSSVEIRACGSNTGALGDPAVDVMKSIFGAKVVA